MSEQLPDSDDRTQYGGQAVVEGVMMRSPRFLSIACRRLSTGEIVVKHEPVDKSLRNFAWLNKPFLRGSLALADAFILGYRALAYSANVQADDLGETPAAEAVDLATAQGGPLLPPVRAASGAAAGTQPLSGIAIGATAVIAVLLGSSLFWILPAIFADMLVHHFGSHAAAVPGAARPSSASHQMGVNLLEGGIRLAIFLAYVLLISLMTNVQRVFQYHGAEHKAINTLEAGLPLTVENARDASRIHPRCGTNFIFIVLMTAIVVFSLVPRHGPADGPGPFLMSHLTRLALLPLVAGVAFEILKFAGSHRRTGWAQALIAPGLWTQYLTTRPPDDSQLEVALAALRSVWDAEHAAPPESRPAEPAAGVA